MDLAERLSELAQALFQASAAVGILEAIEEVLDEYRDGELTLEEAMEEVQGLLEEYQAVRALAEMTPEEIAALAKEDGKEGLRS